uniref:Uncharacterized protein n=1 Tax=uncultured bacterium contig00003 TaxID=1181495 RepID=A0A806KGN8_9BACT|nr:hypothetical protein [uncultured bacterium contig00003]
MLGTSCMGWQGKKCRPRAVLFSLTGPQALLTSIHFCLSP